MSEINIRKLSIITNKKGDLLKGFLKSENKNIDVKEVYLGIASGERKSFNDVKHYRRRKRWLA